MSLRDRQRMNWCLWGGMTAISVATITTAVAFSAEPTLPAATKKKVDFVREIKPLLVAHCHKCHGASKREGGLRLDRRDDARNSGDSGPAFVIGKSAESRIIKYVAGVDPDVLMPPEGDKLTDEQIGLLRGWIDQGADWPADAPAQNGPKSVTSADRSTGSQFPR